jgi:hypothetical protein
VLRILLASVALMLVSCAEPAVPESVDVKMTMGELRSALIDIPADTSDDGSHTSAIAVETLPTGTIVWKLYAGQTLLGRYEITLSSLEDGKVSRADGLYHPADLSNAGPVNPNLPDARTLGRMLNDAMTGQALAADPTIMGASRDANRIIAEYNFKAARTAIDPSATEKFADNPYNRAGDLMDEMANTDKE